MSKRDVLPPSVSEEPAAKKVKSTAPLSEERKESIDVSMSDLSSSASSSPVFLPISGDASNRTAQIVYANAGQTRSARKIMPDSFDVHEHFYPRQTSARARTSKIAQLVDARSQCFPCCSWSSLSSGAVNSNLHPMVASFLSLGNERIIER